MKNNSNEKFNKNVFSGTVKSDIKFDEVYVGLTTVGTRVMIPVDTQRRFNVYKTSIRRRRQRIDVL